MAALSPVAKLRAKALLVATVTVAAGAVAQHLYGGAGQELWSLQLAGVVFAAVMLDAPARDGRTLVRGLLGAAVGLSIYQLALLVLFSRTSGGDLFVVLEVTAVVVLLHLVITLGAWWVGRPRGPRAPTAEA